MFQTLDILIGFSLVMLIMSAAVTMVTQGVGTSMLNLKGRALRKVISRLLALLDRGLHPSDARKIANTILRDPLIAPPRKLAPGNALASVVHREELVKLILDFASNGDASKAHGLQGTASADMEQLRHEIAASLKQNGIDDPAAVLVAIRGAILELEKTSPELSTSMRASIAILTHAASDFVAKVNSWFDQSVDRASDIFTTNIRIVTFFVAVAIALLFQLNSFQLINRLSVDQKLRDQLVEAAIRRVDSGPPTTANVPPAPNASGATGGASSTQKPPSAGQVDSQDKSYVDQVMTQSGARDLEKYGLISFPTSAQEWSNRWPTDGRLDVLLHLVGILLSAALLSLGAPFWYSALANLLKLRSVISRKDDDQRTERQTTQTVAPAAAALPPDYRGGEAGDLTATG
jgi:hypothetical protein